MGKPSIFSKEYERHKRKQKRRIALIVILLLAASGIYFFSGSLKGAVISKINIKKNFNIYSLVKSFKKEDKTPADSEKKQTAETEKTTPAQVKEVEEKGYEITLSDGSKIKAIYETKDSISRFKYVTPADAKISFSINTTGSAMVILDKKSQEMIYVDINQKVQKIVDDKYISTKQDVFNKQDILVSKPGYVWCDSPKFIDEENVAYISQVPWFDDRQDKYVWVFNAKDPNIKSRNDHRLKEALGSPNLKLGNLTEKGLEVITDNWIKYIKFSGKEFQVSE